jgi:adenosylcobinamide-phosphate synthase
MKEALIVLLGALAIDLLVGEPRTLYHPVVWMGRLIDILKKGSPTKPYGILLSFVVIIASAGLCWVLISLSFLAFPALGLIISAFILKSTFSITMLTDTALEVDETIEKDIEAARFRLRALVGRDAKSLNEGEIRSAIIESISENFVDAILSPLFYFTLGTLLGVAEGVALAVAYRAINTLDSMVGYKTEELRELGWASAKIDDLINYIPARLSLPIIALAGISHSALRIGFRDHGRPDSPNPGWPMAAIAGVLRVRLYKPGAYVLGGEFDMPRREHVRRGVWIIRFATAITLVLVGGAIWAS